MLGCVVVAQFVRARLELGQLRFVVAAVLVGELLGVGIRNLTMITAGANIGGGIFLLLGLPALTVATVILAIRVTRHPVSML